MSSMCLEGFFTRSVAAFVQRPSNSWSMLMMTLDTDRTACARMASKFPSRRCVSVCAASKSARSRIAPRTASGTSPSFTLDAISSLKPKSLPRAAFKANRSAPTASASHSCRPCLSRKLCLIASNCATAAEKFRRLPRSRRGSARTSPSCAAVTSSTTMAAWATSCNALSADRNAEFTEVKRPLKHGTCKPMSTSRDQALWNCNSWRVGSTRWATCLLSTTASTVLATRT
mmetsp:Transcript_125705/g.361389  ORF Transcript_125705/g.361389 Transcript_125705/m.361389 type:complete len:230 (-) Transcript_125705:42-731(-)